MYAFSTASPVYTPETSDSDVNLFHDHLPRISVNEASFICGHMWDLMSNCSIHGSQSGYHDTNKSQVSFNSVKAYAIVVFMSNAQYDTIIKCTQWALYI